MTFNRPSFLLTQNSPVATSGRAAIGLNLRHSFVFVLSLLALTAALSSCTKEHLNPPPTGGGGSGGGGSGGSTGNHPTAGDVNVMPVGVNVIGQGFCSANSYTNKPCVSVQICTPGSGNCTVVDDILLDTGSFGLRVFKSKVSGLGLSGGNIYECMEYGDGSRQWGPVVSAQIKLGNEPAFTTQIHVIDSTAPGMSDHCSNAETGPSDAGFNGILGVGVFQADCGAYCATDAGNKVYYQCNGSSCASTTVAEASQVQNPAGLLPATSDGVRDNNGLMLKLPAVGSSGATSVTGWLVFGVATRGNNVPAADHVTMYTDTNYGEITTIYNSNEYRSFIDSGSNAYGIPAGRASLNDCGGNLPGWICPGTELSMSATMRSDGGSPLKTINFKVGDFSQLYGSGNGPAVFSNSAYLSSSNITGLFDWGLPFYFGREVFLGIEGRSAATVASGTYWAF